ncbi:MAG: TonB-dependent receptor [Gammaproteobacteria bacterium]|nr:TonB-dependent receptor [Gammaproteobacteria bacterium]MCP4089229.1 TonB-dependent receptor [Gammaproteobacteria bacterium]MCP4276747.1 TonB-dependent receptor [Gammaproteobacteria bacterium]MCP4830590.1 TonB-dependent receptor [Gammaproteobacteria bacterium]MCP4928399.1 TonB-dependent receptor [Gammaproteobacteria bacterium]
MNTRILVAAGLLVAATPLSTILAAKPETKPEEITVTAVPLGDVLQPTQVLTSEELLLKNAPTLGETLANEPGISSSYFGPAASRPIIRGLSGSRVLMLTDRTSALDASALSPDHAVAIEMLLADKVEIIRGPISLLYGSSAAGGIVNVTDSKIPKDVAERPLSAGVEVRGDTAAEERAIVGRLDGGMGNFAWHIDGFDRKTENLDIPGFATADPAERSVDEVSGTLPNSYSDSDGYSVGISWVGDRGFLGASISGFKSKYGLPGPEEDEGGGDPVVFEGAFLDMDQTRLDIRSEYSLQSDGFKAVKFAFATNSYQHKEIEPSGEVATTFDNDQWQARVEAVHNQIAGFDGALGLQLDYRDFSAEGEEAFIAPTKTKGLGLFIAEEREFEWGGMSLGARAEPLEHTNAVFEDYDKIAFSLAGGVDFDIPGENDFTVNLSYTQRNPSTEELYSDGAHIATRQYEVGLLAVSGGRVTTEDSLNIELGLVRTAGQLQWDVSVFYYDIADYIYQDLTGVVIDDLPEAVYTQADADFYGAEGALSFPLWESTSLAPNLRLFGDFVKAELKDGSKLPRIPPWRLGANFVIGPESWKIGLDTIYNAKQSDISSFQTNDYTMVNMSFTYNLDFARSDWQLFLRGTNLADETARKSTSFLAAYAPLPGRSLHAGFRASF